MEQNDPSKRIILQQVHPDVPLSEAFPRDTIISHFGHSYFTFSAAWFIALAIYEGFERIELYGFQLSKYKPLYARERPCFFYWIEQAKSRGVEITYPPEIGEGPPGDPALYNGPLYGYETT